MAQKLNIGDELLLRSEVIEIRTTQPSNTIEYKVRIIGIGKGLFTSVYIMDNELRYSVHTVIKNDNTDLFLSSTDKNNDKA